MAECTATRNEPSNSLPIRMEKKRKHTQVGTIAVFLGVASLGGAGFNVTRSGTELIAIYLSILGLILLSAGISQLVKANRSQ